MGAWRHQSLTGRAFRTPCGRAATMYKLEDDDTLTVLQEEVTPDNEQQVLDAVRQCPRQAISISE